MKTFSIDELKNAAGLRIVTQRIVATLTMLAERLTAQKARGSNYFIGDAPTALDFYWTAFSTNILDRRWNFRSNVFIYSYHAVGA